jgi:hypothetical protein
MRKEIVIMNIENRIPLLETRPKNNSRVIQKLKRKYKNLTGREYAAGGRETV